MTPSTVNDNFFVAGGTLKATTPSYVKRPTDDELFEAVVAGELCYVLTPRQMGKSSLMIRTSRRLEAQGIRTAIIDLTGIGTKVTIQQWYTSLLMQMSRSLKLDIDTPTWVKERETAGYVQLFTDFIQEVVLEQLQEQAVIFIDEIDSTLGLDFRDDFFAGIRSLYNARAEKPELERVTFVLLGVASPSDLIADPARTPFNIGHPIALKEFSLEEATVLEFGLESGFPGQGKRILDRVFYWTNGHPYLTQKLCKTIAEAEQNNWTDDEIEKLVHQLFLADQARKETNLKFIQDRLLNSEQHIQLLKLYQRSLRTHIREDGQSIIQNQLKLSGLLTTENGFLVIRNKIYRTVFNNKWVSENLPKDLQRFVIIAMAVITLAFIGIFVRDAWVSNKTDVCSGQFYNNPTTNGRVDCLAYVFNTKGWMLNRNQEYKAFDLFYKGLTKDEQVNLFLDYQELSQYGSGVSLENTAGLKQDLVIVIRSLYTTLANTNIEGDSSQEADNTSLLEAMSKALGKIQTEDSKKLKSEIDFWLTARQQFIAKNYQEALNNYSAAINTNNTNPATFYERAIVYSNLGQYKNALSDLDIVMAIAKNSIVREATPTVKAIRITTATTTPKPTSISLPNNASPDVSVTSTFSITTSPPETSVTKNAPIKTATSPVTLTATRTPKPRLTSSPTLTRMMTLTSTLTPTASPTSTLASKPAAERFEANFITYIDRRNAVMFLLAQNSLLSAELLRSPDAYQNLKNADLIPILTPTLTPTTRIQPSPTLTVVPLLHFIGDWTNEDANTGGITRLIISYQDNNYLVQTWGRCHPSDCYWNDDGKYDVVKVTDNTMSVIWTFNFAVESLSLDVISDGRLKVLSSTHFTDNSGRNDYNSTDYFYKTIITPTPQMTSVFPPMILIPAGEFIMGSDSTTDPYFWGAEAPAHKVYLDDYFIDQTEVTNGLYLNCVEAQACRKPLTSNSNQRKSYYGDPQYENYPVINITWQDAKNYCEWVGGRLPSEAEWEKAARGSDGRLFPWGNDPSVSNRVANNSSDTESVGKYPLGASPYGVYDMAGNVLEWVNDYYLPIFYQFSPMENPLGPSSGSKRVIRGGAWSSEISGLRTVARASLKPDDTLDTVGFRCIVDAKSTATLISLIGIVPTDFPSPSIYVRSSPELPSDNSNIVGAVAPGDQVLVTGYTYASWIWYRLDIPEKNFTGVWISGRILIGDTVYDSVKVDGNINLLPNISFATQVAYIPLPSPVALDLNGKWTLAYKFRSGERYSNVTFFQDGTVQAYIDGSESCDGRWALIVSGAFDWTCEKNGVKYIFTASKVDIPNSFMEGPITIKYSDGTIESGWWFATK